MEQVRSEEDDGGWGDLRIEAGSTPCERACPPPESGSDSGATEASSLRPGREWAPRLPVYQRLLLHDDGDGGTCCGRCEGDADHGVPLEGEADGSDPRDRGAGLDGKAPVGAGHCQGPVAAADSHQAELQDEAIAWGKLARELLIQAARDVEGRGFSEGPGDAASARQFFYSQKAEYVHYRGSWFYLAGVTVPTQEAMPRYVEIMAGMRAEPGRKT